MSDVVKFFILASVYTAPEGSYLVYNLQLLSSIWLSIFHVSTQLRFFKPAVQKLVCPKIDHLLYLQEQADQSVSLADQATNAVSSLSSRIDEFDNKLSTITERSVTIGEQSSVLKKCL